MSAIEHQGQPKRSYIVFDSDSTQAEGGFFAVAGKLRRAFGDRACAIENAPAATSFLLVENSKPVTTEALSQLFPAYAFTTQTTASLRTAEAAAMPKCIEEPAAIFMAKPRA